MSSDRLVELWARARIAPQRSDFSILADLGECYVASSPESNAALIIPLADPGSLRGRVLGSIRLRYEAGLRFDVAGRTWSQPAAVIDCLESALDRTFAVVARDVADRLESAPKTAKRVAEALTGWDKLLRRSDRLSDERELGLWGELYLLSVSSCVEEFVGIWRGPHGETMDFFGNGVALECKTSARQLRHSVSLSQAAFTGEMVEPYLASVWVQEDEVAGRTLPELVDQVLALVVDEYSLRKKLLAAGYHDEHRPTYQRRFACPASPKFFDFSVVPRVRQVDPGIFNIRFEVDLSHVPSMPDVAVTKLMRQMTEGAE